jgi:hypothetical protein
MSKPRHDADTANAELILRAVRLSVSIHTGAGARTVPIAIDHRGISRGLVEAAATAMLVEREAANGRQAIIYALDASEAQAVVPRDVWLALLTEALRRDAAPSTKEA